MGGSYAIAIQNTAPTVAHNFCGIAQTVASPLKRGKVYEWEFGSSVAPADYSSRVLIQRFGTALPTGGQVSVAGVVLDPADGASGILAFSGNTAGDTMVTTGILFGIGMNMRATFRWVAAPGKEFVVAATQYAGVGVNVTAQSTAYNADATLYWEE